MPSNQSEYKQRKILRLQGYDYSQPGYYFITIHTYNNKYLFGTMDNKKMILNPAGQIIHDYWNKLENKFLNIKINAFIVMPNHMHGIIQITEMATAPGGGAAGAGPCACPHMSKTGDHTGTPPPDVLKTSGIPDIIGWFKTMTMNAYIRGVKQGTLPPFYKKIWQRGYYERIVRNKKVLENIINYINENPLRWDK